MEEPTNVGDGEPIPVEPDGGIGDGAGPPPIDNELVMVTPDLAVDDFVGLTIEEAEAIAEENIIAYRTVRIDGEEFAVTADYSAGRLNFEIDDGLVTRVTLG